MNANEGARVIRDAIAVRIFPSAVAEVGDRSSALWTEAFGHLTFDETADAAAMDTVFDLASLTKPLVTTTVVMQLLAEDRLRLDEPIADSFEDWRGADRDLVTVADLLEHASGLPARLLDPPPDLRREFEHDICAIPLEYAPRTKSVYSDLGFILLGFLAEARGSATLDAQFDRLRGALGIEGTLGFPRRSLIAGRTHGFAPAVGADLRVGPADAGASVGPSSRIAPTLPLPQDRRKRRLVGEVHDDYAHALGGVAGHAGLFGTAAAVGAFARLVLRAAEGDATVPPPLAPALVRRFTGRSAVPGSSRGLGWDTMLPTSSCGVHMSAGAFGHVGHTGTSLWIDPPRNRYFVLLTNRACGGGTLEEMRVVRRAFHDAWA